MTLFTREYRTLPDFTGLCPLRGLGVSYICNVIKNEASSLTGLRYTKH